MSKPQSPPGPQGRPPARPRRIALVLGAKVYASGQPSPALCRRLDHALELWRDGKVEGMLFSGGGRPHPEAEVMAALARAAGVTDEALYLEPQSRTTEENLRLSKPILEALGGPELVIVSDGWHLPRALLVARRLGLAAEGSAPKDAPRPKARQLLREAAAHLAYRLKF